MSSKFDTKTIAVNNPVKLERCSFNLACMIMCHRDPLVDNIFSVNGTIYTSGHIASQTTYRVWEIQIADLTWHVLCG